jgi:hypothetical protein
MPDVANSDDVQAPEAEYARSQGYRVHHDMLGWYVVGPREREPANGASLGFDGRQHYALCLDAFQRAAGLAKRRSKRGAV